MGAQHQIAGERDEKVLAARRNRLDGAADDRMIIGDARQGRKRGLKLRDGFTRERAVECARRAEDRVAFRHRLHC